MPRADNDLLMYLASVILLMSCSASIFSLPAKSTKVNWLSGIYDDSLTFLVFCWLYLLAEYELYRLWASKFSLEYNLTWKTAWLLELAMFFCVWNTFLSLSPWFRMAYASSLSKIICSLNLSIWIMVFPFTLLSFIFRLVLSRSLLFTFTGTSRFANVLRGEQSGSWVPLDWPY